MDDFEEILKRQSFRPLPPDLRAEILAAASAPAQPAVSASSKRVPTSTTPRPWWSAWLWPSPYAWAALAAAWLVILGLNLADSSSRPAQFPGNFPSSPQFLALLVEQRRLLDELSRPALAHTTPPLDPDSRADSPGACLAPRDPNEAVYV
jgi:hypothetical protein